MRLAEEDVEGCHSTTNDSGYEKLAQAKAASGVTLTTAFG
jgi:hypothetical protein